MTKAVTRRIGVIAIVGLLCCGTLQAQGPARITFVADTPRTTALRESITREVRRQAQTDPQVPAPAPKKKMKTFGRKAGMVAIMIGVGIGVAYLVVWQRAE